MPHLLQCGTTSIRNEKGSCGEFLVAVNPTTLDQGIYRSVGQVDLFAIEAVKTVDLVTVEEAVRFECPTGL